VNARELIKQHEGLRLKAYPDPGSGGEPYTIGYGHTAGVRKGDTCTKEQAEHWLDEDILNASMIVERAVKVSLTNSQRDALISLVFNIGSGAFMKSTLLRLLNMGDYIGASSQFDRWVHASGNVMPGLVKRRKAEKDLFLKDSEVFAQENEMPLPLAGTILVNALPGLIGALPEIANIFKKPDVAERNVEAVTKVGSILMQATGATNMQEAVERVQADPATAKEANEALRMNRADIVDLMDRVNAIDQANIQSARDYNTTEPYMVDVPWLKLKFIHVLSILFVVFSGSFVSVNWSSLSSELKGAVITLMIIAGWNGVRDYWMGSSSGSDKKTEQLMSK
jgi:lysozyme